MNSIHLHLILVHLPIVIMPLGVVILAVGLAKSISTIRTTGLLLLLFAGLMVIPADLTGEASEEKVEHLAGVVESQINEHEEAAEMAMAGGITVAALALLSLAASGFRSLGSYAGVATGATLISGLLISAILFRVGYLGGQIRHPEAYNQLPATGGESITENGEGAGDDD